jgi:hypothetical protein
MAKRSFGQNELFFENKILELLANNISRSDSSTANL